MLCHSAHPDPQPLAASPGCRTGGQEAQPAVPAAAVSAQGQGTPAAGVPSTEQRASPGYTNTRDVQSCPGEGISLSLSFPAHRHALEIMENWRGSWQLGDLGMCSKRMEQGLAGHGFDHLAHCLGAASGGHALVSVVRLSPPSCRRGCPCPCCLLGMSPGLCHP